MPRARVILEAAVLSILAAVFVVTGLVPAWRTLNTDFPNYYVAAKIFRQGGSVSQVYDWIWFQRQKDHSAIETPIVSFIPLTLYSALPIAPLAAMPPLTAKRIWLVVNLLLLGATAVILRRLTARSMVQISILVLLAIQPLRTHFLYGQVHILVLFLLALALWLYMRGRPAWSGAAIAAAAAIKLYPILFGIYFARKRQWRALLGMAASVAVLCVLAVALFGWDANRSYVEQVLPRVAKGENIDPFNLSWNSPTAVLYRLFIFEPQMNPHPVANSTLAFAFFQALVQALLFLPVLWLLTPRKASDDKERLEFAVFAAALLVISTNPASYHYTVLILSAAIAVDFLIVHRFLRQAAALAAVYLLACLTDRLATEGAPARLADLVLLPRMYLTLGLFAFLIAVLARSRRIDMPSWSWPRPVLFATVILLAAGITAAMSLPHVRNEFAGYFPRLPLNSPPLLAAEPAVSENGILFTKLQFPAYTIGVLDQARETSVATDVDLFHAAPVPRSREAFVEESGPASRIVRFEFPAGAPIARVGTVVENGEQPAVSPDGSWLLFLREVRGRAGLWLKDLRSREGSEAAGNERQLASSEHDVLEATFAADSSRVIFSAKPDGTPELFEIALNSSVIRPIPVGAPARFPSVSPDGRWMAYSRLVRGNWRMVIRSLETSQEQPWTSGDCNSISPAWTPDSRFVVFATDCGRGVGMTALARLGPIHDDGFR